MPLNVIDLKKLLKKYLKECKDSKTRIVLEKLNTHIQDMINLISNLQCPYDPKEKLEERIQSRKKFDKTRLNLTARCLKEFLKILEKELSEQNKTMYKSIAATAQDILSKIERTLKNEVEILKNYSPEQNSIYLAAKIFAIEVIPFNQFYDPFVGKNFAGNCWGNCFHWGESVEKPESIDFRMISTENILKDQKRNWTIKEVFFKRVQFYTNTITDRSYADIIWDILKKLQPEDIFNFDYKIPNELEFHATGIRLYGTNGIEFFDSNEGIFRFANKHDFVNFYCLYMLINNNRLIGKATTFTVFRLPYINDPLKNVNPSLVSIPAEEKLAAINLFRSKLLIWHFQFNENNILDLKESELNPDQDKQGKLLTMFMHKIQYELEISEKLNSKSFFFKNKDLVQQQINEMKQDLKKYIHYVQQYAGTDHQKTCLMFALIKNLLQKSDLQNLLSLKDISKWLKEKQVNRELIETFTTNINQHVLGVSSYIEDKTQKSNVSEKNSKM